jgi:hypothetical protein
VSARRHPPPGHRWHGSHGLSRTVWSCSRCGFVFSVLFREPPEPGDLVYEDVGDGGPTVGLTCDERIVQRVMDR